MAVPGIRQMVMANMGTLLGASPVNKFSAGLSSEVSHNWEDVPVKTYDEAGLPDKVRHTFMQKSKQTQLWQLAAFIGYGLNGVDLQVVNEKENSWSPNGGVFNYCGANRFMGFNFVYLISGKERSATVNCKVALDTEEHLSLLQDSLVASAIDLEAFGVGKRGLQPAEYRSPKFVKVDNPSGTAFVNGYELYERSLTIEQVNGDTLEYDRDVLSRVRVSMMFKCKKADGLDVLAYFTKSRYGAIHMQERVSSSVVETFNFGDGVMWRENKYNNAPSSKFMTFGFTRTVAPWDVVIVPSTQTLTINL